jgi:hypothetical protein
MGESTLEFCENLGLKVVDFKQVFNLLKEKNLLETVQKLAEMHSFLGQKLPENAQKSGQKPTKKWQKTFKNMLKRKYFLPLFKCGILLIILSYFTFYPLYYLIFGGVLLVFSLVLLLFGKGKSCD